MTDHPDRGSSRRIIVVTGSPRSGTTAVGDAIAAAPGVMSLYEPLNRTVGDRRVGRYFEVPGTADFPVERALGLADGVAALRLQLRSGIFPDDPAWRRVVKIVTGSRALASYRRARLKPAPTLIWKDPFAVFWLDLLERQRPGVASVVTYRPALAVAASFARLGWTFKPHEVLAHLHEVGAFVHPVAERFVHDQDMTSPARNGAAIWALVYGWHANTAFSDSLLVDAKGFADDPGAYRPLYERLGLAWTPAVERRIEHSQETPSKSAKAAKAPSYGQRAHTKHRNLAAMNSYFSSILTEDDQRVIRDELAPIEEDVTARLWRAGQDAVAR
ncbi:hypothetical protein QDR37_03605 [Amnibacterium sp. CER49]|uniref:sulfotransferase n=1 Tax=Amnibacterium sp. CER49 TaxID=3039161 RepID=UPI00244782E7|nr:sulfotransferase [Amnibacterium sp. CER49]MDH2443026.1 hypothetical protein [Amnibacterium sp. CER49]